MRWLYTKKLDTAEGGVRVSLKKPSNQLFTCFWLIVLDEFFVSSVIVGIIFSAFKGSPLMTIVISGLVLTVYLLLIQKGIHYKKQKLWLLWSFYRNMARDIDMEGGKRIMDLFISREKNLEHRRILEKYSQSLIGGEAYECM